MVGSSRPRWRPAHRSRRARSSARRCAPGCYSCDWHPVGTCAMGVVTDAKGGVIGIEGLHVADASLDASTGARHDEPPHGRGGRTRGRHPRHGPARRGPRRRRRVERHGSSAAHQHRDPGRSTISTARSRSTSRSAGAGLLVDPGRDLLVSARGARGSDSSVAPTSPRTPACPRPRTGGSAASRSRSTSSVRRTCTPCSRKRRRLAGPCVKPATEAAFGSSATSPFRTGTSGRSPTTGVSARRGRTYRDP